MTRFEAMVDRLFTTLSTRQTQRRQFKGVEWVRSERDAMYAESIKICSEAGVAPAISMEDVRAAELNAEGHSDYTKKFAIGIAERIQARIHLLERATQNVL